MTLSFWEPEREDLPFVANEAGFALRVADVAAARAELEAKGVEFIAETWDSGVCHFAAFRDPDGNDPPRVRPAQGTFYVTGGDCVLSPSRPQLFPSAAASRTHV